MAKFKHVFGAGGLFVLLENRSHWLPVNDARWHAPPQLSPDFSFHEEAFYPPDGQNVDITLPDNIRLFSEEARRLEQKRLELLAFEELAKNLQAAQSEYDLEALLERIEFHLQQEDIFK